MPRIARFVAPGYPHHITQRGNRRQRTFFCDEDYKTYLRFLKEWCGKYAVKIWSYCLMPNHVHLIAVPPEASALRAAIAEVHRRYTLEINSREGWKGYLWQGRFSSYVMDERYLLAAARYVELNPVRAGLAATPQLYPWSSARAHCAGLPDPVAQFNVLDSLVDNWGKFIATPLTQEEESELRRHYSTGRPLGGKPFIQSLEQRLGRRLQRLPPGPRPVSREISNVSP